MNNEMNDWKQDEKQKERILWEAKQAIEEALIWAGRNELVDYLSVETRMQLFNGYVLQEHYDTVKRELDISRMSNKILQEAKNGCC